MNKVLMLLKTTGLAYDDRLRKECNSVRALGMEPVVVVLEAQNTGRSGQTEYGVRYHSLRLHTRTWFPPARGLRTKTAEMWAHVLPKVVAERPDVLWIHDMEMMGLLPLAWSFQRLGLVKRIVWDQHELPRDGLLRSPRWSKRIATWMSRCDAVVSANQERLDHLTKTLGPKTTEHGFVLENFADRTFRDLPRAELPRDLRRWLNGTPYFLSQGGADHDRRLDECIRAILSLKGKARLVVVGRFSEQRIEELKGEVGQRLDEQVRFEGMVPQLDMVKYIDNAMASVVCYQEDDMLNNQLCAPNRLHQAIARSVPVVVGHNPPLRRFVEKTGAGVILNSDGKDVAGFVSALRDLMSRRTELAKNAGSNRDNSVWETQEATVAAIAGLASGAAEPRVVNK
jgi:glycosyltransferase involved in cell wall biosynthesis